MFSKHSKNEKGFTLMELMVVMAVATVLMTALVVQQNKWNDSLIVNTQAYELALMIRQAQIYSLGVREYAAGSGDKFNVGYGVYFDDVDYTRYIFFVDSNRNQKYDSGEELETKTLTRGVKINKFCGMQGASSNERCSPDAGNVKFLHITFFRPDPAASILLLNGGGQTSASANPPARIYLVSPGGKTFSVKIQENGQISVI